MVEFDRENADESLSPPDYSPDDIQEITEFISSKAGVMLLVALHDEPKRFLTLEDELNVSNATIQKRLEEARAVSLVEEGDYRNKKHQKVHVLTAKGRAVTHELQLTDLPRIQKEIWRLEDELDDGIESLEDSLLKDSTRLEKKTVEYVSRSGYLSAIMGLSIDDEEHPSNVDLE